MLILAICIVAAYFIFTYAVEKLRMSAGISVKVEEPINVLGQIDKEKAIDVVKNHTKGLESCWDAERREVEGFSGIIRVEAKIDNIGEVHAPKCSILAGQSAGDRFQSCVCGRVNKWRFPPSKTPQGATILFQVYPVE